MVSVAATQERRRHRAADPGGWSVIQAAATNTESRWPS